MTGTEDALRHESYASLVESAEAHDACFVRTDLDCDVEEFAEPMCFTTEGHRRAVSDLLEQREATPRKPRS